MTHASLTAFAFLDAKVKQILDALQRSGLANKATVIIVSDHGFRTYNHKIHPNVLLREKGLLSESSGQAKGDAWVLPEGGTAVVYVTNPNRRAELVPELRSLLTGKEGIDQIFGTEDFSKLGLPTPTTSDQAPDLFLTATSGYMFSVDSDGDYVSQVPAAGTH